MSGLSFRSCAATDTGPCRALNEDRMVVRDDLGLWAVADGAGGHARGEVASGAIEAVLSAIPLGTLPEDLLGEVRQRLQATHESLLAQGAELGLDGVIAATVVVLVAHGEHFACLWAGDSRAYLLRDGALLQLTRDHSLVQDMVETGALAPGEAEAHPHANIITRAVGAGEAELALDKITAPLQPGDRFLLCSDGLCKSLPHDEMAALLGTTWLEQEAALLVHAALARFARDNVTVVTVEVQDV